MLIIPAIDIKEGKCVRLFKGDFQQSKVYYEDPAEIAGIFQDQGAKLIHIVDLNGAKEGKQVNYPVFERIKNAVNIDIELSGGIRTKETVEELYNIGIKRIILGTKVVENIEFLVEVEQYIGNIIISIDIDKEFLYTHGWQTKTDIHYKDYIKKIAEYNIKEIEVTDIDKDGTLEGPDFEFYKKLADEFPEMNIIVSGGISRFDDIKQLVGLKKDNIKGIIIGKAIYEKKINLKEVLEYAG